MARDITTSVRLDEMLDKFMTKMAKNDRRTKATLFYIIIEDYAKDHDFTEWLEENSKPRIPNKSFD
jgi:predicted DNA-binding protein